MGRYVSLLVEIEAVQFNPAGGMDAYAVVEWACKRGTDETEVFVTTPESPGLLPGVGINTLEGTMRAAVGDWIICGTQGEFYPCKPDVFAKKYHLIDGTPVLTVPPSALHPDAERASGIDTRAKAIAAREEDARLKALDAVRGVEKAAALHPDDSVSTVNMAPATGTPESAGRTASPTPHPTAVVDMIQQEGEDRLKAAKEEYDRLMKYTRMLLRHQRCAYAPENVLHNMRERTLCDDGLTSLVLPPARRHDVLKNAPAELMIRLAMEAVETCPADSRMTHAVSRLQEAFQWVADVYDSKSGDEWAFDAHSSVTAVIATLHKQVDTLTARFAKAEKNPNKGG